ncbi:DUF4870 domain-containing protein [Aureisphaera galaxeae]|uniref:DUF4870 domain-containing protein n=1 Tax=Aureisphaera galaxeae TaxID=1538023 RepID=UPI0023509EC1|nr:DUF4870 domain-containing protein [Aureisphaera galaxeae]MDC8004550.1 DUF4870 domain-containing protein [Aureisphaera galaxeae]
MEIIPSSAKRQDNSLLMVTHLSQLLYYLTGFGGLVVPLILWLTQRDKVMGMDEHGKAIVNFQLTLILITILSIPGIFLFGLGILGIIYACIIGFVLPIINAVKANNGEAPSYFSTIRFIS